MKKRGGSGIKISCYGKKYDSILKLANDFGMDKGQYNRLTFLLRKRKLSAEEAVENILSKVKIDAKRKEMKEEKKEEEIKGEIIEIKEKVKVVDVEEKDIITVQPKKEEYHIPLYFTVRTPNEVIEELRRLDVSNINLIDFENVSDKNEINLQSIISKEDTLNIFFYNACIYSNSFYRTIKENYNINLQVHTLEVADQLVDHLIIHYAGALSVAFPEKNFNIISKDTGYCAFLRNINSPNVSMIGCKIHMTAEERYIHCLCKYILSNKTLQHRNVLLHKDFRDVFDAWYLQDNRTATEREIKNLIETLLRLELICIIEKGQFRYYKFDMKKIGGVVTV